MTDSRRPLRLAIWLGLGGLLTAALLGLGVWQVQRRAWKLDLIARVEARVHAAPVSPPAFDRDPASVEYVRVCLTGRFVAGPPTLVQAVTDYGGGFWAMQPLATPRGTIIVNRGFVPPNAPAPAPAGEVTLTGLIRRSEPGGGFLRANDPAGGRWYSRDVAAIAAARGIAGPVAPWFVDAAASGTGWPKGGLTVVRFRNNHLVYALTWFALAAMVAGAMAMLVRSERRRDAGREETGVIDAPWLSLARRVTGSPDRTGARNMRQLVELRWLAVAGQLATILIVGGPMRVPLPLVAMLSIVGAQALVNLASVPRMRQRTIGNLELFVALLFDIAALTAQLALSGGATNPFVSLFLLQVVLAAILLEAWAAWAVVAITGLCFALLTAVYRPLRLPPALDAAHLYTLGAWLCFGLIATLLMMFVTRITRNLRARDARLADLRQRAAEEDHIVRMGMLASGAAHELGTPLASLSVALSDWRRMPVFQRHRDLRDEIGEMQGEVARCKAIVTGILQSAGEPRGEAPEVISAHVFLDRVVAEWRATHAAVPLDYRREAVADVAIVADPALRQAIANVLDNAGEASPDGIELEASRADGQLVVAVRDRGAGFAPALLADFGKPYISTKGSGHGVGLFLAVNVVRKLGGRADAANRADGGAVVTLTLPLSTIGMTGGMTGDG